MILILVFFPWHCFFFLPWGFRVSLGSVAPLFYSSPCSYTYWGESFLHRLLSNTTSSPNHSLTLPTNCKDSWGSSTGRNRKGHVVFSHSVHRSLLPHPKQMVGSLASRGRKKSNWDLSWLIGSLIHHYIVFLCFLFFLQDCWILKEKSLRALWLVF